MRSRWVLLPVVLTAIVVACGGSGDEGPTHVPRPDTDDPVDAAKGGTSSSGSSASPSSVGADGGCVEKDIFDKLLQCCPSGTGTGYCIPEAVIPKEAHGVLGGCKTGSATAGRCVPELVFKGGVSKSCTSIGERPGVCFPLCLPDVAKYKELVPQSVCAAEERCVPCNNPFSNEPTGACDPLPGISICAPPGTVSDASVPRDASRADAPPPLACPYNGPPIINPKTFVSCYAGDTAHCVPKDLLPADARGMLGDCSTSDAGTSATDGACVPDLFLETAGQFILPTCDSIGGGEGRCVHRVIPQVKEQESRLPQSSCKEHERCVPCFNPLDGKPTGLCKLTCDPGPNASRPIFTFPGCCTQNNEQHGKCLPSEFIPEEGKSYLRQDTCAEDDRCVPTELLEPGFEGAACTAFSVAYLGNYQGVCLSNCLSFDTLTSLTIAQGSCPATHRCAPCRTPSGEPTNAPGCNR